jgi:DNA-binding CsgD family transcriptional regulator
MHMLTNLNTGPMSGSASGGVDLSALGNALGAAFGGSSRSSEAPATAALPQAFESLAALLELVDCAILIVTLDGHALFSNSRAHKELLVPGVIDLQGGTLRLSQQSVNDRLDYELNAARLGKRSLIVLPTQGEPTTVAVLPLAARSNSGEPYAVALVSGRTDIASRPEIVMFARHFGLTPTEARVLDALCAGFRPKDIAEREQVAESTVRTHVKALCTKTGTAGIQDVLRMIARLPPVATRDVALAGSTSSPAPRGRKRV